jgi:hypothetical protein
MLISNFPRRKDVPLIEGTRINLDLTYPIVISGLPDPQGNLFCRDGVLNVPSVDAVRGTALCPAVDYPPDEEEYIEVTAASIRSVLDSGLSQETWIEGDALVHPVAAFTKSPPSSRSSLLERALLHGQDEESETTLMARLGKKAAQFVGELRTWVDDQMTQIEERGLKLSRPE